MGTFRFLLALSVLTSHLGPIPSFYPPDGSISVQAFFLISGFYMALVLTEKYKGPNQTSLFLTNRFLRIYPPYLFILLISALYLYFIRYPFPSLYESQPPFLRDCATGQDLNIESRVVLIIVNILIIGQDVTLFFGSNNEGAIAWQNGRLPSLHGCYLLAQGWSLGMELIFYLLAPFLVKQKNWTLTNIVVSGFLLKIILFYCIIHNFHNLFNIHIQGAWTLRFLPAEVAFFTIGILSFRFYRKFKTLLDLTTWSRLSNFLLIAMLGVTVFYGTIGDIYPTFLKYTYFSLMFFAVPCLFHRTKANKADQFLGDLSYPIFVNHILVIWIFQGMHSIVTTFVSIVFAFFMKKYLIDPIDKIRMKRYNILTLNQ